MQIRTCLAAIVVLSFAAFGIAGADAPATKSAPTPACPAVVTAAATKAFPDSKQTACKPHKAGFEVKLTKKDGKSVELDLAADGTIEQIEEIVPFDQVTAAVTKAFVARYPKGKLSRAEKMTKPGKSVEFELLFTIDGKTKEATFSDDGKFIEEE